MPEQVAPLLPPLPLPLLLVPLHVVPELLPDEPRQVLEQFCSSQVARGLDVDEQALVIVPSQEVTLQASYVPLGQTHAT